jgi:hypothetical protein
MVREEKGIQGFGGKPERKRPPGLPRRRWEDNMKRDLKQQDWTDIEQDRDKSCCDNGNELWGL